MTIPTQSALGGEDPLLSPVTNTPSLIVVDQSNTETRRLRTDELGNLLVTGSVTASPASLLLKAEYDGNSLLIYFADAVPGSLTSAAVWRIRKLSYDGNGNFTTLAWPNADTSFSYVWNIRSTYTYS